jgi:hypothetical protein
VVAGEEFAAEGRDADVSPGVVMVIQDLLPGPRLN